jgi:hypothetical protein
MSEENNEISFDDVENVSFSKEDITIRGIALNHVKKILSLSCDEFTGGYYNTVTEFHNGLKYVKKVYVPDARAKYYQAIDNLYYLLDPFFDSKFIEANKVIQTMSIKTNDDRLKKACILFTELSRLLNRKNYLAD